MPKGHWGFDSLPPQKNNMEYIETAATVILIAAFIYGAVKIQLWLDDNYSKRSKP